MTAAALQPDAKTLQENHRSATRSFGDPARSRARIRARIAETAPEEAQLRVLLVLAHEVLGRREEGASDETQSPEVQEHAAWTPSQRAVAVQDYSDLVPRIRRLATRVVPPGASILVTSRGDNALLDLPGLTGAHFPQGEGGGWAGFYPADSESAIAQLEALRREGGDFLLLPRTGFWWLDHYDELRAHLAEHYAEVARDDDCVLFSLEEAGR